MAYANAATNNTVTTDARREGLPQQHASLSLALVEGGAAPDFPGVCCAVIVAGVITAAAPPPSRMGTVGSVRLWKGSGVPP